MSLFEERSYYQILELTPDASFHEIREAYQRLKHAYSKDSVAMYSLLSEDECLSVLDSIEKAYSVLSSETARREYDRNFDSNFRAFERAIPSEEPLPSAAPSNSNSFFGDADPLVAPATSLDLAREEPIAEYPEVRTERPPEREITRQAPAASLYSAPATSEPTPPAETRRPKGAREFPADTEWTGALLRSVREEAGIPIEEMVAQTRISKTYLRAIEDEDFSKLPAIVFARGFVTQIARILKLPADRAVPGYIARLERAKSAK